jgi:outer membrane protein TolC
MTRIGNGKAIVYGLGVIFILLCCQVTALAISLDECVELALENNPDLQKQRMGLRLADHDMAEQQAKNYGRLDLVSGYTHYNLPRTLTPLTPAALVGGSAGVPTTEDLFNVGVLYELELFTGFSQTRSVEVSALEKELAGAGLKLSEEQLIYNVKTLYVNILSLKAQEEAQASYVKALLRLSEDVRREVELGRKARIDLLKASADLKNSVSKREQIAVNLRITKSTLASLLNVKIDSESLQEMDLSPAKIIIQPSPKPNLDRLQRLRATRLAVEKNSKLVEKNQAILYPKIILSSSYGQSFGPNDDSNANDGDWENQEVWQAGLNLRWSLFDFGGNDAKIQKARTLVRQSRYEKLKVELELKRALDEAEASINLAVTEYHNAREELALTQETEIIEQVRFDQGAADINDLLYTKARNQLALSRFIGAGYNYKTACYYLDYLLENGEDK